MAFFVYVSNDGKVRIPRWNEKLQPHWQEPVLDEFQPLNDFSPVDPTFKVRTYRLEKIIGPKNLTQAGILWLAERIFGGPKADVDAFNVLVENHDAVTVTGLQEGILQVFTWSWEFTTAEWVDAYAMSNGFAVLLTQPLPERGPNWCRSILGVIA